MNGHSKFLRSDPVDTAMGRAPEASPGQVLAKRLYAVLFALPALYIGLQMQSGEGYLSLLFLVVTLLVLVSRLWLVEWLLIFIGIELWFLEPRSLVQYTDDVLWFSVVIGTMTIAGTRYLMLSSSVIHASTRFGQSLSVLIRGPQAAHAVFSSRRIHTLSLFELLSGFGRIVAACVLATWLLSYFPPNPNSIGQAGLKPFALQAVQIGLTVFFAAVIFNSLLNLITWRWISPSQARIYLNSVLTRWNFSEQRAIAKRLAKRHHR